MAPAGSSYVRTPEHRRLMSEQLRGRALAPEHRAAISRGLMGNKRDPEAIGRGVARAWKTRVGRPTAARGRPKSLVAKAQMSVAKKRLVESSPEFRAHLIEVGRRAAMTERNRQHCQALAAANRGRARPDAHRRAIAEGQRRRLASDARARTRLVEHILAVSRNRRRYGFLDARGRLWSFRSSWERRFAEALDRKGLAWDYEPCRLLLPDGRIYVPDFYVHEWHTYVEIKGRARPGALNKIESARALGHTVTLLHGREALRTALVALEV